MKVSSWNVNGIRSILKKGNLATYLEQEKPDVLLLQEVRALEEQIHDEMANNPHPIFKEYTMLYHPAEKKGYSGVAVWTHNTHTPQNVQRGIPNFTDSEGRAIAVCLNEKTIFFSLYIPNGGKSEEAFQHKLNFMEALTTHTKTCIAEGYEVILGGDFNIAHHAIDIAQPEKHEESKQFSEKLTTILDALIAEGVVDTFRETHPKEAVYSYWDNFDFSLPRGTKPREVNRGWRIDYIFATKGIYKAKKQAEIHTQVYGSDHCPVVLEWE